jgi:hypothetical protein
MSFKGNGKYFTAIGCDVGQENKNGKQAITSLVIKQNLSTLKQ